MLFGECACRSLSRYRNETHEISLLESCRFSNFEPVSLMPSRRLCEALKLNPDSSITLYYEREAVERGAHERLIGVAICVMIQKPARLRYSHLPSHSMVEHGYDTWPLNYPSIISFGPRPE